MKEKKSPVFVTLFCPEDIFLMFVFYLNLLCIERTFIISILLHIKKHCFLRFYCLFFKLGKAVTRRCSVKKLFLKILQNSQEKTCARFSFLIKLQALGLQLIKKETLAQVFPCEFCEIPRKTFFYRTPSVAASDHRKPSVYP